MKDIKENLTEKELEEAIRKKKNEYQRKWREKNKDKVKEYNQRYWKRQALKDIEA